MAIRVMVAGASGRMGREVVKTVCMDADTELVAAIDLVHTGEDAGVLAGVSAVGVPVTNDLSSAIQNTHPEVMVDFTQPAQVMGNLRIALSNGVCPVVGTTGIQDNQLKEIQELCSKNNLSCLVAPNFAIGAVLMMQFAAQAAKYMPDVEIIELHHDRKLDAPSGTALKTAEMIAGNRLSGFEPKDPTKIEKLTGARGGKLAGIPIHSVRLPGLVAHQEVLFGGLGQTLTIRHDSINRESFMPGVLLGVKQILDQHGLVYGLEKLLSD